MIGVYWLVIRVLGHKMKGGLKEFIDFAVWTLQIIQVGDGRYMYGISFVHPPPPPSASYTRSVSLLFQVVSQVSRVSSANIPAALATVYKVVSLMQLQVCLASFSQGNTPVNSTTHQNTLFFNCAGNRPTTRMHRIVCVSRTSEHVDLLLHLHLCLVRLLPPQSPPHLWSPSTVGVSDDRRSDLMDHRCCSAPRAAQ
jgi:hypothetical protein